MSTSRVTRAILAAIALCIAPSIATAQAPQSKRCGDGTTSSRSYFACLGHGGVDTSRAVEGPHAASPKHHSAEAVQAGEPRSKHAKSTAHTKPTAHAKSKASVHHARTEHHPAPAAKKKSEEGHRGWLPWRHKHDNKADAKKPKKPKKHEKSETSSRLPVPERPNGRP
jgi:hypothetical protein